MRVAARASARESGGGNGELERTDGEEGLEGEPGVGLRAGGNRATRLVAVRGR